MNAALATLRDGDAPKEARARELFEGLVGRRTGIVRQIALVGTIDGDARLFHAGAQIANAHPAFHAEHLGLGVGGAGPTPADAVISALCEGVERYACASYPPLGTACAAGLPAGLATARELGDRALRPDAFVRFSERQRADPTFPLSRATDDTPLRWVSGTDVVTGAPRLVPAFAVYMPYVNAEHEPLVGVGLSTGLSCAPALDVAIDNALLEVVERDAMALCWVRGVTPPRIDPACVQRLSGDLLPPHDQVTAFDITTDVGLPVVLVIGVGDGPRGQLVSVGSACHPDPVRALRKAAMEASQDRVYVRLLIERDPGWQPSADFGNVTDFSLHARLYSGRPALVRRGLAFLEGGSVHPWSTRAAEAPRAAMARLGLTAVAIDLTPPWAAPLGLAVARVVAPDLVPLHGSHALRYLGHERLGRAIAVMPRGELRHELSVWPYPHPMP
jgi:ribosomal protein S12 methylthiotransferase accessory factor